MFKFTVQSIIEVGLLEIILVQFYSTFSVSIVTVSNFLGVITLLMPERSINGFNVKCVLLDVFG